MDTIAGMKKLVPSVLSRVIMIALTSSAGNASSAEDGGDEDAPHRQRHAHQRHALGNGPAAPW